jgi:hypothetical protein
VLRQKFGQAEARRHYVDLEYFGRDPFTNLKPDYDAMEARYGRAPLAVAGTLPWTIESYSDALAAGWRSRDCSAILSTAGYIAHYVGDASQPLHSTIHYDGVTRGDHGIHSRFEGAVDRDIPRIERTARPQVHVQEIGQPWIAVIAELRQANGLVDQVIQSDRAVRATGVRSWDGYDSALMDRDRAMVSRQVADAASVLASIWLCEWKRADRPSACATPTMDVTSPPNRLLKLSTPR